MTRRRFAALAAALCLFLPYAAARAQDAVEIAMLARAGYDGTVISGAYVPLEVEFTARHAISGTLSVPVYAKEGYYDTVETPVEAAAGETAHLRMLVRPERKQNAFVVTLTEDGETVARAVADVTAQVSDDALTVGVLDESGRLAPALAVTAGKDPLGRTGDVAAVPLSARTFPQDERELEAFSALAVDAFDVATLSEAQREMMKKWIARGGFLLAGTGDAQRNSLGWLEELTGVKAGEPVLAAGALDAVLGYAGVAQSGGEAEEQIRPLTAPQGQALATLEDACVLAASRVGDGLVMTFAFSLTLPDALEALSGEALWQRLLTAYDGAYYADLGERSSGQTEYSYGLNDAQRVSEGVSILPAALLLVAYAAVAGFGLYAIARRLDRSNALWALLPLAALACIAGIACLSGVLKLDEPTAASFTVAEYAEDGEVSAQEVASIGYASQERVRVSTADNRPVARHGSYYFYSYAEGEDAGRERDKITLGDEPSIELPAGAPWLLRTLDIGDAAVPQGRVTVRAWMEADGLHASVENGTDAALLDAVLLTRLGYAPVGDVEAGASADALIARPDGRAYDEQGYERILPGKLLGAAQALTSVVNACVYPEEQAQAEFDTGSLSPAEQQARTLLNGMMNTANHGTSENDLAVTLFARCDEPQQAALLLNGEPIERTAHVNVVLARVAYEPVGPTGVFLYPASAFEAREAELGASGEPRMGGELEDRFVNVASQPVYGFSLADVPGRIERISVDSTNAGRQEDGGYAICAWDFERKAWTPISQTSLGEMDAEAAARCVSAEGELFLRYDAPEGADGGVYAYVPQIIVEGGDAK